MAANLVTLISSDNKTFEVDVAVAMEFEMVKEIMEANRINARINEPIHLPQQVQGDILAKVVEYCKYHVESRRTSNDKPATPEDEIKAWDADFVKVDRETMLAITAAADYLKIKNLVECSSDQAADYLKIKNLVDLTSQALVDMVTGKTAEEIGEMFNIKNDFNPEEEAEIRRQLDEWACKMVPGKTAEEIREVFNIKK